MDKINQVNTSHPAPPKQEQISSKQAFLSPSMKVPTHPPFLGVPKNKCSEERVRPNIDKRPLGYQITDMVSQIGDTQEHLETLLQGLLQTSWEATEKLREKELEFDKDIKEKIEENELLHWMQEGARLLFIAAQGALGGVQGTLFGGLLLFSGACSVLASFLSKPECMQWFTAYAQKLDLPKEILGVYLPLALTIISVVIPVGVGTGSYIFNGSHSFSAKNFMTQLQTLLTPFLSVKQSINRSALSERKSQQTALKEEIDWQEYFVTSAINTFPILYSSSQTGFKIAADCIRELHHLISLTAQEI